MSGIDIREEFLKTYANSGFRRTPGASLVQPSIRTSFLFSVGFIDAVKAIEEGTSEVNRMTTVQRCFRHFDVQRVSDGRHLSLFEMAGALRSRDWRGVEELVHPLVRLLLGHLPARRIHVTWFGGGPVDGGGLSADTTARDAYLEAGITAGNIWLGDASTNFWFEGASSGMERSGFCGPHSEIFIAPDERSHPDGPLEAPDSFVEVANTVTITHRAKPGAGLSALPHSLIEVAAGMERLEMVLNGVETVHDTPKLRRLTGAVRESAGLPSLPPAETRVAVDHVRALTHLLADGGRPGWKGRGNVVRRLFRRWLEAAGALELDARDAYPGLAAVVAEVDDKLNPNLRGALPEIVEVADREMFRELSRAKQAS